MPKTSGGESAKPSKSGSAKPPAPSDGQDAIPQGISLSRTPPFKGSTPAIVEQATLAQPDQTLTYTPTLSKSQRKQLTDLNSGAPDSSDLTASRAFTDAMLSDAPPPPLPALSQIRADVGSALAQAPAFTASLSTAEKLQQSLELQVQ